MKITNELIVGDKMRPLENKEMLITINFLNCTNNVLALQKTSLYEL